MKKKEILCIKLGGSVITNKLIPYSPQIQEITNIAHILKKISSPLIISHGSGSFGHTSAQKYGGKHGYLHRKGLAKVARDAREINHIVMEVLLQAKLPVFSFSPLSFLISDTGIVHEQFLKPLLLALDQGLIPVIYGDIILDTVWKTTIVSGERILSIICQFLQKNNYQIDKIIQLCNTDGVYDNEGNIIPQITQEIFPKIKRVITGSFSTDVTGGMYEKVTNALVTAKYGIPTVIINGTKQGQLINCLKGEKTGTIIF